MHGGKRDRLINADGEPFLGQPLFRDRHVNSRDVLRGLYLGGLRDNPDVRKETEKAHQVKIGGGRCYIVDIKTMLDMNLDGEKLAEEAHEDKLNDYHRRGLIVSTEGAADPKTQRYFYIRHRLGPGQSDDAAFIMAGILYNPDVALGVFLADAIDTIEKYAPVYSDQDGNLSFLIARGFPQLGLSNDDVNELIALASIPEAEEHMVPDSSMRYLLALDPRSSSSAFRNHLDFIEGNPVLPLPVSYKRILSTQFYEYINRRLLNVRNLEKFAIPTMKLKELDRPLMDLAKKDYAVIAKDATIADAVRKFKESHSEILIVQDKNSKVVGTIRPSDLLGYMPSGDGVA
jgi:CBS domain-containing protein